MGLCESKLSPTTIGEKPDRTCDLMDIPVLTVQLPPVVNELLCFVQNQIEAQDRELIVQICSDFYSFDVINAAKSLLFKHVNTRQRCVNRIGNNKSRTSMNDIVTVFLEMELKGRPVFVAQNLFDLPPLGINSMDSVKVLHDIADMKCQMDAITRGHKELHQCIASQVKTQNPTPSQTAASDAPTHVLQQPSKDNQVDEVPTDCESEKQDGGYTAESESESSGQPETVPPPRPVFPRTFVNSRNKASYKEALHSGRQQQQPWKLQHAQHHSQQRGPQRGLQHVAQQ